MSFDTSRFSFHPWNDYFGVVMQQGRVQLDADWNEWVAELGRRLQAGTMDTVGRAVVPRTTPEGFHILAAGGLLSIGIGRMYVDGLLVENHGTAASVWDANLAEVKGSKPTPFLDQPYLPFNETSQPAPADIFNRPALVGGPHLLYLDVWQRELTHVQAPELVEKAVGIDTTGRLQTVWQVKLLPNIGNAGCFSPDADLPGWTSLTRPSGARLSNSTGIVPGELNPCLAPASAGYKGLENQLYRIEIQRGGPQATATFKWSRDNATVATPVLEIQGGNRLVVESLGRDDVLGFHAGDWVEIVDDWHELHGLSGRLHRIRPGDGVDAATRSIVLETALPAGLFPVNGQGRTLFDRHTRVRRWDQSGTVRQANGDAYHDLDASGTSDGIPVPSAGTKLALENGILINFSLASGGEFLAGDYWVFAARTSDGSIEPLVQAAARGIHHHYARLAIVSLPDTENDCRIFWPPEVSGESCDCTVCVHAEGHNAGVATIQQAIDAVRRRGGGTICLDVGKYLLRSPLDMHNVRSLRLRGQGWQTILQPAEAGGAIDIEHGLGVTLENLSITGIVSGGTTTAMIGIADSIDVHLERLTIAAAATGNATSAAIGLSGLILSTTIRDCVLVAEQAVVSMSSEKKFLLTANLRLHDNVLMCSQVGIGFTGSSLHYGQLRIVSNLALICARGGIIVTGAALPAASVTIQGNILHVTGDGLVAGTDGLRIDGNEIFALAGKPNGSAITLAPGLDKGAINRLYITGNRIHGQRGHGIAVRHRIGRMTVSSNTIENTVGGGLVMAADTSADYVSIEGNQFTNLGIGFNNEALPFFGLQLVNVKRADVVGNLFANLARQAARCPLRAAVMAISSGELRFAGNRMFAIGPLSFSGRTVGIMVAPGFGDVAVSENSIERLKAAEEKEKVESAEWQALLIVGATNHDMEGIYKIFKNIPDFIIVADPKNTPLYLSEGQITLLAIRQANVLVRGNCLRGHASMVPTAQILSVHGCLFDQNTIRVTEGKNEGNLTGHIQSDHAGVANNRLVSSSDEKNSFLLFVNKSKYSVLGNLRTAPILVNGNPDTSLPPPWNTLNVSI